MKIVPCILLVFALVSCEDGDANGWQMRKLVKSIESHPERNEEWAELLRYARSGSYWERIYAFQAFPVIAPKLSDSRKAELSQLYQQSLKDPEQEIRKLTLKGIQAFGEGGVNGNLIEVLNVLEQRKSHDESRFAVEALGFVSGEDATKRTFDILFHICARPIPIGETTESPMLREYALRSALKLAQSGYVDDPIGRFRELKRRGKDPGWQSRVDEAIRALQKGEKRPASR